MRKMPRSEFVQTPAQMRLRTSLAEGSLLLLLAIVLFNTNRMFTFIDDEIDMLGPAARPTGVFLSSLGALLRGHEHPPLYDIFLNLWLHLTGGAMDWLRAPSVVFYIVGLFFLSRAARRLAGLAGSTALIWLGVFWPYGFHFGRLAGWYSLAFFLISGLTWAYLRHADLLAEHGTPSACRSAWICACVFGVALVYANYLGWALLFLLAIDDWIRNRARTGTLKRLLVTAAVFVVVYAPLWPALRREIAAGTGIHQSWQFRAANLAYNTYILFVSESMAPWFWRFGVPAALAVAACVILGLFALRGTAQRLLIFAGLVLLAMATGGILYPRRLFLAAPWILLAVAAGIGTVKNHYWRSAMALSLALIAAAGWYGFYARRYYATPRFFEPWETVAQDAADTVRGGGLVIGNNPSFLFYLTYALQLPQSPSGFHFAGVVTQAFENPQIWQPEQWEQAGRPLRPNVLWVLGMPNPPQRSSMADQSKWLDEHCAGHNDRYMARDPSFEMKQRFAPEINQALWRVEIHNYACSIAPPTAVATPPTP
jgi:hypothetical protein